MKQRELELIQNWISGNDGALEQAWKHFYREALATAARLSGDPDMAEDVVQEAFLEAHKSITKLENPGAFRFWFRRILVQKTDRIYRKHTWREIPVNIEDFSLPANSLLESEWIQKETTATIRSTFALLPREEREVLEDRYLLDLGPTEIASKRNLPLHTVKNLLVRAKRSLRSDIGKRGIGPDSFTMMIGRAA